MKLKITFMISALLLSGCFGSNDRQPNLSKDTILNSGTGGSINYCRPSSVMRIAETVEIYINGDNSELNGDLAAKVKNGNQGSLAIDINKNFTFGLKPRLLYMRPTTQIAFSGNATSKKDRYFIIQGKPNYAQGTAIFLGGIIGATELDKRQESGQANWEIASVSKSEFDDTCK